MDSEIAPLPPGPFGVIYLDPPWRYLTYDRKRAVPGRAAADPYVTMTLEQLRALPIADVAAKDCALVMWAIGSHTDQAIELGRALGFKFIRGELFVWVKVFKAGSPAIGMGKWSRNAAECCLLFARGKPRPMSHSVRQVRLAPRRQHSRKPDEFREDIEALFGDVSRLEMFSRSDRPGWSHWGAEVGKFD